MLVTPKLGLPPLVAACTRWGLLPRMVKRNLVEVDYSTWEDEEDRTPAMMEHTKWCNGDYCHGEAMRFSLEGNMVVFVFQKWADADRFRWIHGVG